MGTKELYLPSSARTGGVALPAGTESEILREQEQLRVELELERARLNHFNKELYQIDRDLSVVLAKPNSTHPDLKPGYYHLVRIRPGHPCYIKPVQGPNGEWRDLDSSIFDLVAEDDLWNDRVVRDRRMKARAAESARQRQKDREAQDRAGEFDERWKSLHSTSVLIPRSITS